VLPACVCALLLRHLPSRADGTAAYRCIAETGRRISSWRIGLHRGRVEVRCDGARVKARPASRRTSQEFA